MISLKWGVGDGMMKGGANMMRDGTKQGLIMSHSALTRPSFPLSLCLAWPVSL